MERIKGTVHDIQVIRRGSIKYMRFGLRGGWQGAFDSSRPFRPVFPYQRAFAALLPLFADERLSFLSIGVGTGTSLRSVQAAYPTAELYGVELDEHVLDTAIHQFEAPTHKVANYFVGDGLEFLRTSTDTFQLIFVDAYMSNRIYSPCLDETVPKLVSERLAEDGVACFNFITQLPPVDRLDAWLTAAQSFYRSIQLIPVGFPYSQQNTLAVLSKGGLPAEAVRKTLRRSPYLRAWEKLTWPMRMNTSYTKLRE